jgi:hypothetical protein
VATIAIVGTVGEVIVTVAVLIAAMPVILLAHPVLRALGRRGTIRRSGTHLDVRLDREAFRKA